MLLLKCCPSTRAFYWYVHSVTSVYLTSVSYHIMTFLNVLVIFLIKSVCLDSFGSYLGAGMMKVSMVADWNEAKCGLIGTSWPNVYKFLFSLTLFTFLCQNGKHFTEILKWNKKKWTIEYVTWPRLCNAGQLQVDADAKGHPKAFQVNNLYGLWSKKDHF